MSRIAVNCLIHCDLGRLGKKSDETAPSASRHELCKNDKPARLRIANSAMRRQRPRRGGLVFDGNVLHVFATSPRDTIDSEIHGNRRRKIQSKKSLNVASNGRRQIHQSLGDRNVFFPRSGERGCECLPTICELPRIIPALTPSCF